VSGSGYGLKHATFGVRSGRIFDRLLDLRSHRVIVSQHYGDATDSGNAESNARKGGDQHEIQPRLAGETGS
jgi:hypothetical protein